METTRKNLISFIKSLPGVEDVHVTVYKKSRTFMVHVFYTYGPPPKEVSREIKSNFVISRLKVNRLVREEDIPPSEEKIVANKIHKRLPASIKNMFLLNNTMRFS